MPRERKRLGEPTLAALDRQRADRARRRARRAGAPGGIVEAAALLARARHIFCLGHRSCYAPAYHFAYVAGLYGAPTRLLDAPGGIGADGLNAATADDALLAISFAPYTRATVEVADDAPRAAACRSSRVTDSRTSPLARIATRTITVPTDIAEATYVTSPAFAAAEMLAALVVAQSGPEGRAVLERNEAEFARRRVYWDGTREARRVSRPASFIAAISAAPAGRRQRAGASTITDAAGKTYIDASGGAAVSCLGHRPPRHSCRHARADGAA